MSKKTAAKTATQINMAALLAVTNAAAEAAATPAPAAEVAPVVPDSAEPSVPVPSAKEIPVLRAIVATKAFENVASLSKIKGVEPKSVPGIVASLGKKGFVQTWPSFMGTLYAPTEAGEEASMLTE